jgi:urea transporter
MLAAVAPLPIELRILLRSLGQIVLQANAITGACVLAALACTGLPATCAALLGASAANIVAHLAGHDRADGLRGLHGFNGALAALAAVSFIADASAGFGLALIAASVAGWIGGPLARWLRMRGLCAYSSPCLAVTACWLPFHASAAHAVGAPGWTLGDAFGGSCAGVAQAAFAQGAPAGLWMLLGLAVASRRAAGFAFAGALAGSLALLALGADAAALRAGLLGFNGALTALALAEHGAATAAVGVIAAACAQWLALRAGFTTLTLPFVLATWFTLIARRTADGVLDVLRTPR